MDIIEILSIGISGITARYFVPRIYKILSANSKYVSNYNGRPVVTGMGLALMFPCLLVLFLFCCMELNLITWPFDSCCYVGGFGLLMICLVMERPRE